MARGLTATVLALVVVIAVGAPLAHAARSSKSGGDTKAPKAEAPESPAEAPKEAAAEGPRAGTEKKVPMEGPEFVDFVIKNPIDPMMSTPPPSPVSKKKLRGSGGLPVDPPPEGTKKSSRADGLPVYPTPEGSQE
ncbi:hypothetical protein ACP70R_015742 [Stipagrostis hirtigluma subsp. patula]